MCSSVADQQACEEGCAEPEATTGADYSGDTLHASDEGTQQYVDKEIKCMMATKHLQINSHGRWFRI